MERMNETWQALAREAALGAEHLAIGVSALARANYAQHAYYGQAFFALTTGLERTAKLALVVDYTLQSSGTFPSHNLIRSYGHNLKRLLEQSDVIAERRGLAAPEGRLPRTAIHDSIIEVLSDFANNITRYYNLDFVTGNSRTVKKDDPIRAWFDLVITPVLAAHYQLQHRQKHQINAELIARLLDAHTMVRYHAETGNALDSVYSASMQTAMTEYAKPYTRMYIMQIARFLARLVSELGYAAYIAKLETIPHLSDFYAIFNNSDRYFRQRKTWSIYRP